MKAPRFIGLMIVKRNPKKKPALRDLGGFAGIRKAVYFTNPTLVNYPMKT